MSRIGKNPVAVPKGVDVTINDSQITVKGAKGELKASIPSVISVSHEDAQLSVVYDRSNARQNALAGTMRATIANMVHGVSQGFERKLSMVGVGYRAQVKSPSVLALSLGYSHPIEYVAPEGITIETPSQTDIIVRGCDKQAVGQAAANIRAYRAPEPYKGKGVRYADEVIIRKEAKKK
ncbi:MAG: ribosomal protein [Pseudomonadota bacterium]|jgi:large subunit ribosomal protein L6